MSFINLFFRFSAIIALFFVLALIAGCASPKKGRAYSASELFKKSKHLAKDEKVKEAKEVVQKLLEDYPDSKERVGATMLLADLHYGEREYEEAKFQYQTFIELYPAHKYVDRAHFYQAMSNFQLTDLASRDLTPVHSALEGFERFAKDFPKSSYIKSAEGKINQCLDILAQNIFEIGKFYYRTGAYQAAILRLNRLKVEYPDHSYILEADFLLGESYYHEQNFPKASTHYKIVIKSSPRSKFAKEARLRLKAMH